MNLSLYDNNVGSARKGNRGIKSESKRRKKVLEDIYIIVEICISKFIYEFFYFS